MVEKRIIMDEPGLKRLRADFPILSSRVGRLPLTYFDNGATTQKPRIVIDSLSHYYRKQNANVHRAVHELATAATRAYEEARQTVARWLRVDAREIIWTRGVTESINLVAQAFLAPRLAPGDRILLLVSNHHANILPWHQLAQTRGAILDIVGLTPSGDIDLTQYASLLERHPKLVALTHVSNALGTVYPIAEMVQQARQQGAWTLVDGAQALPHFDVDLRALDADFYTFSGHKTFGPTGIGVLYGRYALLETMPPWQTGGEMIEHVSFDEVKFAPPPLRFEAGTPNISAAIGLASAIDYLTQRDRKALELHEQSLLQYAISRLEGLSGIELLAAGEHRVAIISCRFDRFQVADVAAYLDSQGIAVRAGHHCAQPLHDYLKIDSSLRISLAFYNTKEEIDRLVEALSVLLEGPELGGDVEPADGFSALLEAPDWQSRFSALMALARSLPPEPASLRQPEWEVFGCATRAWMRLELDSDGRVQLATDAQSSLLRGLLYLISYRVNNRLITEIDISAIENELQELGFESHLSHTRGNAIQRLLEHLRSLLGAC